jgi:hypothetical protein
MKDSDDADAVVIERIDDLAGLIDNTAFKRPLEVRRRLKDMVKQKAEALVRCAELRR